MRKLVMLKCTACGRLKCFDKWLKLDEIQPKEHREKLSWLIVTDGVDFQFIHCSKCLHLYKR